MGKAVSTVEKILRVPRADWIVKADDIRDLWKDYPEFQEIFPDLISNLDYDKAIARAIVDFNAIPPMTIFSPSFFPDEWLLLNKSFIEVLETILYYHANNHFSGTSAGVQIPVHEQFQALIPLKDRLQMKVEKREERLKRNINIQNGFGGTSHYEAWGSVW